MRQSEKEALVDLLNAHTNKIATLINGYPNIRSEYRYDAQQRLDAAERAFLAEPEEVVAT
ncbi:hypothetical protein D3C75_1012700 [compost metagenome]